MNLVVKVAGVTFQNPDGSDRQGIIKEIVHDIWSGSLQEFKLEREPDNPHDPNAVKVLYGKDEYWRCVGYIPKEQAVYLSKWLEQDKIRALELHEAGKYADKYFLGLRMVILEEKKL